MRACRLGPRGPEAATSDDVALAQFGCETGAGTKLGPHFGRRARVPLVQPAAAAASSAQPDYCPVVQAEYADSRRDLDAMSRRKQAKPRSLKSEYYFIF